MIVLTPTAVTKVNEFMAENDAADQGLRVAVLPGGCSGFQYSLNIEDAPEGDDDVLDVEGVRVFVNGRAQKLRVNLDMLNQDFVAKYDPLRIGAGGGPVPRPGRGEPGSSWRVVPGRNGGVSACGA